MATYFDRSARIWNNEPTSNQNSYSAGGGALELELGPAAGAAEAATASSPGCELILWLPDDYEPSELEKSRVITSVSFSAYTYAPSANAASRRLVIGKVNTPPGSVSGYTSVTWNTRPTPRVAFKTMPKARQDTGWSWQSVEFTTETELSFIKSLLEKTVTLVIWPEVVDQIGLDIYGNPTYERISVTSGGQGTTRDMAPQMQINLGGELYSTIGVNNTSGSIDPAQANLFSWEYHRNGFGLGTSPTQASAVFKWTSIADGTEHTTEISGTGFSVTVPANTFPTTGITWQATLTDTDGNVTQTPVYTIETGDRVTTATPVSPVNNVYLDEKVPIQFTWALFNAAGSAATGTELQWRVRGAENWTALGSVTGTATSYTAAASTFPGDDLEWRARGINQDNVPSPWSEPARFTTADPLSVCTAVSPRNGQFVNEKEPISLTWTASNPLSGYIPSKSEIQWMAAGDADWTALATLTNSERSFTVPANTFPSALITWRVRAYNNDDKPGAWAEATFTTEDELTVCTATAPTNLFRNPGSGIQFTWTSRNATSAITGFDLDYDANDGQGWQRFAQLRQTAVTSYTAPANTFPAVSTLKWRVRGYNDDNVAGGWSNVLTFATLDAETLAAPIYPINGVSADETAPIQFRWNTSNALRSDPAGAELQWATVDEEESYQALGAVTGTAKSLTVPANTFPGAVIYWRIRGVNQSGVKSRWLKANFTTLDTPSVSVPVSPNGTIENTDEGIVFRWETSNISGTLPTAAEAQYRYENDEEWTELGSTDGTTHLEIDGGEIDAGTVYWRVRSFNRNGYAGDWSEPVSFAAYAAPKIRGVFADGQPYTTITWQVEGQLAYELRVDDKIYGAYFGAGVRSFTLPDPLADGSHIAELRAQNKYGLWSKWSAVEFSVQSAATSLLLLEAEGGTDVSLTWTGGGSRPPEIIAHPESMRAQSGLVCFSCAAEGEGLTYAWEVLMPNAAAWQNSTPGVIAQLWTRDAAASLDGMRIRCRVSNPAGSALSNEATFTWGSPIEPPLITVQPESVQKNTGTVRLWCGATGTDYRWYRADAYTGQEDPDAIVITDGAGGYWHIPSGVGAADTVGVSDGGAGHWHFPAGEGEIGAVTLTDGASQWSMPSGSGSAIFIDMGVSTPYITFPATAERDGNRFFCRVSNTVGAVSSEVCTFTFAEEEIPEQRGDYTVYRDGVAIAKTVRNLFIDRTVLGSHVYQVIQRTDNNDAVRSNFAEATAEVSCLMIAPLFGGAWLDLGLSDKQNRDLQFSRAANVAYTSFSGMRFPAVEVGEQEELSGSFDASFLYRDAAKAAALEAMLGVAVILKSERGDLLIGVLEGWKRTDRRFYKPYTFSLRQMEWRDFIRET